MLMLEVGSIVWLEAESFSQFFWHMDEISWQLNFVELESIASFIVMYCINYYDK